MNRLAGELSPYLLQHAGNPVDWYPWGEESLGRAKAEQKPIFLSIGYSACHWCHVMAHESFARAEIAHRLRDDFISIKVDREERPELDQIYMRAVQAMTGQGGWPLSVFLTPDQQPFFGGTYWPAEGRGGMPGFGEVLAAVADAWRDRRAAVLEQSTRLVALLRDEPFGGAAGGGAVELTEAPLAVAEAALRSTFDRRDGGFGPAPKFPTVTQLQLLLRRWRRLAGDDRREMVVVTLDRMAAGGIRDHLGGGFHRYSVDAAWLVPHFEKMLYDNAMLAGCYLDAWQATGVGDYAHIARETLDYVLRDMTAAEGGFHSAEDADSEGEEGKFYLWTPGEVAEVLGPERAVIFCQVYDATGPGNFEGRNILHLARPIADAAATMAREPAALAAELAADRQNLLAARGGRIRPARDDKILVSWNGLMIDALARAGAALAEPRYITAAARAADFLLDQLRDPQGRLLHCWRAGQARHLALLDDHASLANALITLDAAQGGGRWLDEAVRLADSILTRFVDPAAGGFFYTPADHEPLITRTKDFVDSPVPSSTALAVTVLLRLARRTGRDDYRRRAIETLRGCMAWMDAAPLAAGQLLIALDMLLEEEGEED